MSDVPFVKMHGIGNDFVIIDLRENQIECSPEQIEDISDRYFGIGCDQLVMVDPARNEGSHASIRFFNPDASESSACGNATRCVAWLIYKETKQSTVVLDTQNRTLTCQVNPMNGMVSVDMGKPNMDWKQIPLSEKCDTLNLSVGDFDDMVAVNVGNPHVVCFIADIENVNYEHDGPAIEYDDLFPERVNVNFAQIMGDDEIGLVVWERGAGLTLACGSGACASFYAAHKKGYVGSEAIVHLPGGRLVVRLEDNGHITMIGPTQFVFSGNYTLDGKDK